MRIERTKLLCCVVMLVGALLDPSSVFAQGATTFQYFYDDLGQLAKVIDSSGNEIDYSYDAVGNITAITRGTAPGAGTLAVLSFTPQQGGPGATVTVTGQGFSATPSSDTVQFNGTAASVTSATTTTLVVSVPSGAATGPISVKVGTATATSSTNFTVLQVPMITSVSPTKVNFNTTVPNFQVTGANLTGATFSFVPVFSPPAVTVTAASVGAGGTSATLSLSVGGGPAGTFVLIATNANGSSSSVPTSANSLQVLNPSQDVTPPTISITSPASGSSLIAGQTISVVANATDNVGVTEVNFLVNGVSLAAVLTAPYSFMFTVPAGVSNLTFSGTARDAAGNVGTATPVTVSVVPDPLTTLQGTVVDSNNNPLSGATATVQVNGLNAQFFQFSSKITTLPNLTGLTPNLTKLVSALNMLNPNQLFGADPFGVSLGQNYAGLFTSQIQVSTPGTYTFTIGADEGVSLSVGGNVIINTPSGPGVFQQSAGTVSLSSGFTPIVVEYYRSLGASEVQLSYTGPGVIQQVVPPAAYSTEASQFTATSDSQGNFSIPNVPTNLGNISVTTTATSNGNPLSGMSSPATPIGGGITSIGNIAALPSHWIQLAPTDVPPAPPDTPGVYDPITNRLITFGGATADGSNSNAVWVLTNADGSAGVPEWLNLTPLSDHVNGLPPARNSNSAAYDPLTNRMIIFGGCLENCGEPTNDTWVLTNANGLGGVPAWIELSPTGGPPSPRAGLSAVYDPGTNSMIIFGGQNGCCAFPVTFSDVWVLSNANGLGGTPAWTQLSPSGGPPAGQTGHSAIYDPLNNVMTAFGGQPNQSQSGTNAVWVLSSANGQGGTPAWTNIVAEGAFGAPPARSAHAAVYNTTSNRMTIFGGLNQGIFYNDTWVLTNANGIGGAVAWTQLVPSGGPPAARATGATLDIASDQMTIFGGGDSTGALNDAWVLAGADGLSAPSAAGGTVSGLVTLNGGTPAPNALVQIFSTDSGSPFSRSGRTDSNGNYTIAGVPSARTFTVSAFDPNGRSRADSTNNTIAANGQTLTINLVLPPSATVQVTVLKVDGTPFAGAEISLQDSFRQFLRIVGFADSSGVLNITDVPRGSFTVQAQDPNTLSILGTFNGTVTSTDGGQTLEVTMQDPGTTVIGNVVDTNGSPVPGAQVTIIGGPSTTTAADGTFSISSVPIAVGNIEIDVTFTKADGTLLVGTSSSVPPVPAGITNVGTIKIAPPASKAYVANVGEDDISAYTIDAATGALTPVPGSPFATADAPQSVTVDPTGHFVYVAICGNDSGVSAYSIDAASGALTPVPGSPFPNNFCPVSLTVEPSGHFVYTTDDSADISGYSINPISGALTEVPGSPFPNGCSVSVSADPIGSFVYAAGYCFNDVAADKIDTTSGALTPVAGSPFPAALNPESVTVDPTGHFVYVANARANDISAYTIDTVTGALTQVPGSPFPSGNFPDSVTVDPTGHFVYVANSGEADISAYSIDTSTGTLTQVTGSPFPSAGFPTSVAVDPTGHFVYTANDDFPGSVSAYSIDIATGALTPVPGSPFPAGTEPYSVTTTAGPH